MILVLRFGSKTSGGNRWELVTNISKGQACVRRIPSSLDPESSSEGLTFPIHLQVLDIMG